MCIADANRDLLKDQTIDANLGARVNDDPVGVGYQQATPDLTIERNICSGDNAPKSMS